MLQQPRRCDRCGTQLSSQARFCARCGARVTDQPAGLSVMKILWAVGLALAATSLGALGACFFISGIGMIGSGGASLVTGLLMWLVAVSAFVGIVKIVR
jgi:hypothetical protein